MLTKETLERFQKLVGKSFIVSNEKDDILTIKPADYRIDMNIRKKDLELTDESFVKHILDPALNNLQGILDQERPYHLNRHQELIAKFKKSA